LRKLQFFTTEECSTAEPFWNTASAALVAAARRLAEDQSVSPSPPDLPAGAGLPDEAGLPRLVVRGAWPTYRRGHEDWRSAAEWPADVEHEVGNLAELFLPTVEVWVADTPDAREAFDVVGGQRVRVSFDESVREDYDGVVVGVESAEVPGVGFEVALPASLLELTARAAMLAGDPMLLAFDLVTGPLEPEWWMRTPQQEADLVVACRARAVRTGTKWLAIRSLDLPPAEVYFEAKPPEAP
jgi:hypothetical protein